MSVLDPLSPSLANMAFNYRAKNSQKNRRYLLLSELEKSQKFLRKKGANNNSSSRNKFLQSQAYQQTSDEKVPRGVLNSRISRDRVRESSNIKVASGEDLFDQTGLSGSLSRENLAKERKRNKLLRSVNSLLYYSGDNAKSTESIKGPTLVAIQTKKPSTARYLQHVSPVSRLADSKVLQSKANDSINHAKPKVSTVTVTLPESATIQSFVNER